MAGVIIDIYNSGVLVSDEDDVLLDIPSHALVKSKSEILIGEEVKSLGPSQVQDYCVNYWNDLSAETKTNTVVSNSEIAFQHLSLICDSISLPDVVYVLTPNNFSKQNLGVLLGICQKLGINVCGIASNALFSLETPVHDARVLYLDLLQEQILLTELEHNQISLAASTPLAIVPFGKCHITNNIVNVIAEEFINETRFDPISSADYEIKLLENLEYWLNDLFTTGKCICTLSDLDSEYSIEIQESSILNANVSILAEIIKQLSLRYKKDRQLLIICSSNFQYVNFLTDSLKTLPGTFVKILKKTSLSKQALKYTSIFNSNNENIHYTTSLNWLENTYIEKLNFNGGTVSSLHNTPTHLLNNYKAYLLDDSLYLTHTPELTQLSIKRTDSKNTIAVITKVGYLVVCKITTNVDLLLNGKKIEEQTHIYAGDTISLGKSHDTMLFIKEHE